MDTIGISLVAVLLLLLANGFFVAAEFALVKAKGTRLAAEAATGRVAARLTVAMQNKTEPYLAACQLGITMASLGLGWIGEPAVAALLEPVLSMWDLSEAAIHQIAFVVGFLVFSSLHIVIGEQVPKSLAIRKAEPVSMLAAYPLQFFYVLAYPLTWLLDRASRGILTLFRVGEGTYADVLTMGDLKGVVATSEAHGQIPAKSAAMLHNLIEFDERPVSWVMLPRNRVKVLDLSAAPEDNVAVICDSKHSRFPLVEGGGSESVIGVVLGKDLFEAVLRGRAAPWNDLRSHAREPLVIPETITVSRAFETLRQQREHVAIVVDEYGEFVGIVSVEDLLEEVVGEILDEKDTVESLFAVQRLGAGRWIVDGSMPLSDAQRELGFQTDFHIEANTLSGLMMEKLGRIPGEGDHLAEGAFRLTAKTVEERHVTRMLVERLGDAEPEP